MSIAQTIYTQLRQAGLTEAGALGMLGNWQCESPGLLAYQVEGDFSPYRTVSKDYTARVERGAISRQQFGSDQKGYGLAQWTYVNEPRTAGRKFNLYDYWKKSGSALDDPIMQTNFALHELQHDYAHVGKKLKTENDLYTAVKIICVQYEQPRINNIDERFRAAKEIKAQLDTSTDAPTNTPTDGWEKIPATEYWPPRTICEGMDGKDVVLLRSVLYARSWVDYVDDDFFDKGLTAVAKHFQETYGLDVDGIVGPLTWGKLLERG